jgi:hypothetical protein
MEIIGNIIDADYVLENNLPVIRLLISTANSKAVIKDKSVEPYCYIVNADEDKNRQTPG